MYLSQLYVPISYCMSTVGVCLLLSHKKAFPLCVNKNKVVFISTLVFIAPLQMAKKIMTDDERPYLNRCKSTKG